MRTGREVLQVDVPRTSARAVFRLACGHRHLPTFFDRPIVIANGVCVRGSWQPDASGRTLWHFNFKAQALRGLPPFDFDRTVRRGHTAFGPSQIAGLRFNQPSLVTRLDRTYPRARILKEPKSDPRPSRGPGYRRSRQHSREWRGYRPAQEPPKPRRCSRDLDFLCACGPIPVSYTHLTLPTTPYV